MKVAINGCTWGSYARHLGKKRTWRTFVREAAQAGYGGVEFGGSDETTGPPDKCRKFIESLGLEIAASGLNVTYNPYPPNTRQYKQSIRYAARLGVKTLMCCGGFLPSQRRNTYDWDYDMFAGNLGAAIEYAGKHGLTVAFHNHRGCVVETIRETREMVQRLGDDFKICVDIAHLEASGQDALKYIRTFGKHIVYTHIKDYSWRHDSFVELGKGDGALDVGACIRELENAGYDGWLTVELDKKWFAKRPPTALDSARMCRRYLKKCGH